MVLQQATEDYYFSFDLWTPRAFQLSDVSGLGQDDPAVHDYPPAADPLTAAPIVAAYDGVTAIGAITGTISQGGFATTLTIPKYPANFADYFGADLTITPVYANGATTPIRVFRGYMRGVTATHKWQADSVLFDIKSSASFLQDATFSRGIDWMSGLDHSGPTTPTAIIEHLLDQHTNLAPRTPYTVALPDQTWDRFSLNEGSVYQMLQAVANAAALEGWVFCRRGDDLLVTAHPNLIGSVYPTYDSPTYEFTDTVMLGVDVPEQPPDQVARVLLVAKTSNQTELTSEAFNPGGVGSSEKKTDLRCDDQTTLDNLAALYLAHKNRRYQNVKVSLSMNVNVDLGDVVTVTTSIPQRDITWTAKRFVVTGISYRPQITVDANGVVRRTWLGDVTLDEVLAV